MSVVWSVEYRVKNFFCLVALLALAGCNSIIKEDGDWFEGSGHSLEQFQADDQSCHTSVSDHISYDLVGHFETSYQETRTYNALYEKCMLSRGYQRRPYYKNWLPE